MTESFVTLEDVNGALYNNQHFWWHEIDTWIISEAEDFTDVKCDFCKVSRTKSGSNYTFTIEINNSYWTLGYNLLTKDGGMLIESVYLENGKLKINTSRPSLRILLQMGSISFQSLSLMAWYLKDNEISLNLKELKSPQNIILVRWHDKATTTTSKTLERGLNLIKEDGNNRGYLYVNLVKSDFQFNCNQQLTLGKVNTVRLGASADYKPSGDMIGNNTPNITVKYGNIYIPVTFDSTVNDYVFDIDLTCKQNEGKVRFNVLIEANDVINATETEVTLNSSFETINNESKLRTLFRNGGIGRLGANITLTNDLTLNKDVLIIGNDKTINMNAHKIIVPTGKTFKSENTVYTNGYNTIQQYTGSTVELTDCTFTGCTGLGSVIDCQLDMESLEIENDFTTNITGCTFSNNDMCILHGGELNIENCTVTGKIGNPSYPYFLYQTDGNAIILQSKFTLQSDSQISTDIEFNSCIFICGETATINGYDHNQLQNNNLTVFTTTQKNSSKINVTYYYPTISNYITLQSDNGYCHSVSNIDYVFKSNVTLRRE